MGERTVHANGVELCAESFGDPADPAILLIHGAGNSMLSWEEALCARLAAGGRLVVRYDSRDAGRSVTYEPGAPPYALSDLVADAVGLVDALGLARGHLVGMSTGGVIAQLAALDHPGRVASLTLASTTPGIPGEETADLPGPSVAAEPATPDWTDRAAVIEYIVEAERPYAARFYEAAARKLATRVADRATDIAASLTNPFRADADAVLRPRLGDIAAPTLVLHGIDDPMFPYRHAVALADEIPGAELIPLANTGHEYFPPATWDVVVPAILRHTAG
jgi:pimeloyl-ACP methyl ester carboxylesterase